MTSFDGIKHNIESLYETPSLLETNEGKKEVREVISLLDQGQIRVASPKDSGGWEVNEWVKKAILLYFKTESNEKLHSGDIQYFDKIKVKNWDESRGVRVVPPAVARYGSFISKGAILMPSYVNIGAYVGQGTMIDTWATVGSCAQIGSNVHLSGGVGIGGVLEPLQAQPVIIEDNVFVGSRCVIVEGLHIEEGAVIGAGVVLTSSTKILDVSGSQPKEVQGRVPKNSVVIPGIRNRRFPAGDYGIPCALIIGKRSTSTDQKTSLNDVLRDYEVSV